MRPIFHIEINGQNVTSGLIDRILSLEVTESSGGQSDRCTISIDDRDDGVSLAGSGDIMKVKMGYDFMGLVDMGEFTVDEPEVSGWPKHIQITANATPMNSKFKTQHTKNYKDTTLGDIVRTIAARNGMEVQISDKLTSFEYKEINQVTQSDMSFLERLAKEHDAVFKIANGRMIFHASGDEFTPGGSRLAEMTISPAPRRDIPAATTASDLGIKSYRVRLNDRNKNKGVRASSWDADGTGEADEETENDSDDNDSDGDSKNDPEDEPTETTHLAPTNKEAKRRARSRSNRMKRAVGAGSFELVGDPRITVQTKLNVVNCRRDAADGRWLVVSTKHSINGSGGFSTSVECEFTNEGGSSFRGGGGGKTITQVQPLY